MSSPEIHGSIGPDGNAAGAFSFSPPSPYRPRWWLHALLFLVTLGTATFMGAIFYGWVPASLSRLGWLGLVLHPTFVTEGLKFAGPLLAILLAHEMGHYIAARRHGLVTTPPFFIPMPIPLPFSPGTMGAVMRIKQPIWTRAQLLDIGAWGPISGFVVTLPVLLIGLANSQVREFSGAGPLVYFAEPILFKVAARVLFFPGLSGTEDIYLHPMAWAAWWGMLVTALNMLPFFQLDGGHVTYAMFGRHQRRWARPLLAALVILAAFWPGWALWAAVLVLVGPGHPRIPDEATPLDSKRMVIGWIALTIFILCFTAAPIQLW